MENLILNLKLCSANVFLFAALLIGSVLGSSLISRKNWIWKFLGLFIRLIVMGLSIIAYRYVVYKLI